MNIDNFIKKRTRDYPNRCKNGYCASCGRKQENEAFYGLSWRKVDSEMADAAEIFGAPFFGYVCTSCYRRYTGKDYRKMNISDHLTRINEKRKNQK